MMLMKGECLNNFKSPDVECCTIKPLSQQCAAGWFCVSHLPQQANGVYGLKNEDINFQGFKNGPQTLMRKLTTIMKLFSLG